jgi:imidazolonepropionase-like amidohydrolase
MKIAQAAAALVAAGVVAMASPAAEVPIVITGAKVLDPSGQKWLDGQAVLVAGDKIEKVAPAADVEVPPGARQIDGKGMYLIPGLMDLHTHLCLRPYDQMKWDDQVLKETPELRTIRATAHARATVDAGFTTIRDLGTEGAGVADVAMRDAISRHIVVGPRVFASTRAIVAAACYGPTVGGVYDSKWSFPKGAQEANGVDGVRLAVREQLAAGADWVKLYADYRRGPGSPSTATFTVEELKAAVDEAKSAGKPTAAHATTDEGIRRAVLAGFDTIEHGYGASRETLQLMKDKGAVLCPTMAAAEAVARYAGWKQGQPEPESLRQSRASFKLAREVGVTIVCGSDAGVFAHGDNARELELMVAAGMPPGEALRSATIVGAKVLRKENELGQIKPGFAADLALVRGDPLADVAALRQVVVVIAQGQVVRSAPGTAAAKDK